MDRQAIERRDFPIARRGYATAAVDAHLRALAAEIEELSARASAEGAEQSLAATASTQVQSILQAAETAAAEIERQSLQSAHDMREEAERDAEATREQAIAQARAHVTAVAQATSILLERVSSMDGEVSALVEGLRAGASMLAGDLAAIDRNMGELYDAASQGAVSERPSVAVSARLRVQEVVTREVPAEAVAPVSPVPAPHQPPAEQPPSDEAFYDEDASDEELLDEGSLGEAPLDEPDQLHEVHGLGAQQLHEEAPHGEDQPDRADAAAQPGHEGHEPEMAGDNGDLDGARLIALNMALNGDSRAETDRYLAENFELSDRQRLIDEVYAAVEG